MFIDDHAGGGVACLDIDYAMLDARLRYDGANRLGQVNELQARFCVQMLVGVSSSTT